MITRRGFFGAIAGVAAACRLMPKAEANAEASSRTATEWSIEQQANQRVPIDRQHALDYEWLKMCSSRHRRKTIWHDHEVLLNGATPACDCAIRLRENAELWRC